MIHINSIDLFHWTNVISGRLWWCHSLRSHCCTGALVFQYWSQDDFRDKGDSSANGAYTVTADGSSGSSSLQISLKLLLRGSSRSPWSTSGRLIWNLASLPPFINTLALAASIELIVPLRVCAILGHFLNQCSACSKWQFDPQEEQKTVYLLKLLFSIMLF